MGQGASITRRTGARPIAAVQAAITISRQLLVRLLNRGGDNRVVRRLISVAPENRILRDG